MPTFRPERALLHPLWLGALVLLALNDQVLKGAGILPGWFTGKASDFAGLLVAPALLGAMVRVRGDRGLLACHVAVGLGFGALEVFPALVAAVESVLPVRMWADPTDLLALLVLPISFAVFRAQARTAPRSQPLTIALGIVGFVFCAATSRPAPEFPEWGDSFESSLYLYNASAQPLAVRVEIPPVAPRHCAEVANNPAFTDPSGFTRVGDWTLDPHQNMPIYIREDAEGCVVVAINGQIFSYAPERLPAETVPTHQRVQRPGELVWDGTRIERSPSVGR